MNSAITHEVRAYFLCAAGATICLILLKGPVITMPKSADQKLRLLYLERIFLEETDEANPLTLKDLTARLADLGINAERKTLYDDFECLTRAGIEILRNAGGYYTESRLFETAELKLLVDAAASSRFLSEKKTALLIEKLTRLASKQGAGELNRQVVTTSPLSTVNEQVFYNIDALHSAIRENLSVTFLYFDRNEKKEVVFRRDGSEYKVSPWALLWDDEKYYLLGYDEEKKQLRHYRVDKMKNVTPTSSPRTGKKEFSKIKLDTFRTKVFGMFDGKEEMVTLKVDNTLSGVILDRFSDAPVFLKEDETHFRTTVKVVPSPNFYGWVASFGGKVRVLSPEPVRTELREYAERLLNE